MPGQNCRFLSCRVSRPFQLAGLLLGVGQSVKDRRSHAATEREPDASGHFRRSPDALPIQIEPEPYEVFVARLSNRQEAGPGEVGDASFFFLLASIQEQKEDNAVARCNRFAPLPVVRSKGINSNAVTTAASRRRLAS